MVAVFCRYLKDYNELNLTPQENFKRITHPLDIIGIEFKSVIRLYDWYYCDLDTLRAYEMLQQRQPELFK